MNIQKVSLLQEGEMFEEEGREALLSIRMYDLEKQMHTLNMLLKDEEWPNFIDFLVEMIDKVWFRSPIEYREYLSNRMIRTLVGEE